MMKKIWSLFLLLPLLSGAQNLTLSKTDLPLSQEALKKGMFVTSTLDDQGNMLSFVAYDLKKNLLGYDVITVNKKGEFVGVTRQSVQPGTDPGYEVDVPKATEVVNPAEGLAVMRLSATSDSPTKLSLDAGRFDPIYRTNNDNVGNVISYTRVLRGFKFIAEKSQDLENSLQIFATHSIADNQLQAKYELLENSSTSLAYFPADASITMLGKNLQPVQRNINPHNLLTTAKFDGKTKTITELKTHELDYNFGLVTTGITAKGDRALLVSTLNAPTNNAAHQKWQAGDAPFMTYVSMNAAGELVDKINFKASAIRGTFYLFSSKKADYILGAVDGAYKGYYNADLNKPSQFDILKIENGAVVQQHSYTTEVIANTLHKKPGGKKGKHAFKSIQFEQAYTLKNGDILIFATSEDDNIILQLTADAQLKASYAVPRMSGKDFSRSGVQVAEYKDEIYLLYREQAPFMTSAKVKSNVGTASSAKIAFDRAEELNTFGRIVKINTKSLNCSSPIDIKEDVIVGEKPLFLSETGALILLLRDKNSAFKLGRIQ